MIADIQECFLNLLMLLTLICKLLIYYIEVPLLRPPLAPTKGGLNSKAGIYSKAQVL